MHNDEINRLAEDAIRLADESTDGALSWEECDSIKTAVERLRDAALASSKSAPAAEGEREASLRQLSERIRESGGGPLYIDFRAADALDSFLADRPALPAPVDSAPSDRLIAAHAYLREREIDMSAEELAELLRIVRDGQEAQGWRWVPEEPTMAMGDAGERAWLVDEIPAAKTWADVVCNVYRAMLAAAPTSPAARQTQQGEHP